MEANPEEGQGQEGETIGEGLLVAVSQEAEAGTALTGGPLVAREAMIAEVNSEASAQGRLVSDLFDVRLEEGEGDLYLPSPVGWIEGFAAALVGFGEAVAAQDVADGVGEISRLYSLWRYQARRRRPYPVTFQSWTTSVSVAGSVWRGERWGRRERSWKAAGLPSWARRTHLRITWREVCQREAVLRMLPVSW